MITYVILQLSYTEFKWIYMGVYGCGYVQWCTMKTKRGKLGTGGTDRHDLWSRVAGKFPDTSCLDTHDQKNRKMSNNHTEDESRPA